MKRKLALGVTIVLGAIILLFTFFSDAINPPPTEEEWYILQANRLRKLKITGKMRGNALHCDDRHRVMSSEGLVAFPNGDWIYIVFNSVHDYERYKLTQIKRKNRFEIPARWPVGDAVLALGSDGGLYTLGVHVCGGLVLPTSAESASLATFLASTYMGPSWEKYDGHPPRGNSGELDAYLLLEDCMVEIIDPDLRWNPFSEYTVLPDGSIQ